MYRLALQHFNYPAGSFIFPVPVLALGWHEISLFYLLCLLLTYALLAWWAPRRLRPWLVPMALANLTVWDYATVTRAGEGLAGLLFTIWPVGCLPGP